ncbi:MAG: trypsin-like peptidase domain-containing protein, partial [Pseudomonadota bacterium]
MLIRKLLLIASLSLAVAVTGAKAEGRIPAEALQSVVSVLPVWDGRPQGGTSDARGFAPEGSGVIVRPGVIATAWHVIEPAERIDVRLSDGRILPARLIAHDGATDVALLAVDTDLPPIAIADEPALAEPVCTIGNAFGLGLSVTCGVISALDVTDAGFNGIEDFLQTDAATNPGVSGGALVDSDGHLVGLMMAIFASDADANVGVNFAISAHLLARVIDGLMTDGHVNYPRAGWHLGPTPAAQRPVIAAPLVRDVAAVGPAADAGVRPGDLIVGIGSRRVRTPRDAITALAILPEGAPSVGVVLWRDGVEHRVELKLPSSAGPADRALPDPGAGGRECPHPPGVCAIRQAVFPISSFDPVGSATRIGTSLLVTNRHVMGDRMDAVVHTPDGPKDARVVASSYHGDLVLLDVNGLPPGGITVDLDAGGAAPEPGRFYAIGADVARQEIRVFEPG